MATGGRGGDVYPVTTLANSGTGSLRTGISSATGPRTIVFRVSGNIVLTSSLTINKPNITIAGQTAPGDGICLQNYQLNVSASDVVVRHIRVRLGTNALQEADCIWINGGSNIILDHCSASWSVDETLSASSGARNVTVQWCNIAESLNKSIHAKGNHGYGSLITPNSDTTYSWHHNLYAHNNSRNPRPGTDSGATVVFDFRNNVVFNWGGRAGYGSDWDPDPEKLRMNYVGNYLVAGPSSTYNYAYQGGGTNTVIYQSGNSLDVDKDSRFDGVDTGWGMFSGSYVKTNAAFPAPELTTDPAAVALFRVLAQGGARPWNRDTTDRRIQNTVHRHVGSIVDFVNPTAPTGDYVTNTVVGTRYVGVGPWPVLASEAAPVDSDNDGMPDHWEMATGLNRLASGDRNIKDEAGYTMLENYLNWLAEPHALCDRNGSVTLDLKALFGGATNLNFSVGSATNGTAVANAGGTNVLFSATGDFSGLAGFSVMATDGATGIGFGPVTIGILVTTTNSPVSNTAPILPPVADRQVMAGTRLSFTNTATDADLPIQALTYNLLSAPAGAAVDPVTGVFTWRPLISQGGTTNSLQLKVSDSGSPALSATQSFTILVAPAPSPTVTPNTLAQDGPTLTINGASGPDYVLQSSTNLVDWTALETNLAPAVPFEWSPRTSDMPNPVFYRLQLGP